jgi:hypothetical protein
VRSARGTVAIGFIAARTRSTSPVDMPPSVPPEQSALRPFAEPGGGLYRWDGVPPFGWTR